MGWRATPLTVQERDETGQALVIVSFDGELDAGDPSCEDELQSIVAAGARNVVVDMSQVCFIDSSIVRALLLTHEAVEGTGGWLRLVYTHHMVRRVIEICGLGDVLPQYSSLQSARRGVQATAPPGDVGQEGRR